MFDNCTSYSELSGTLIKSLSESFLEHTNTAIAIIKMAITITEIRILIFFFPPSLLVSRLLCLLIVQPPDYVFEIFRNKGRIPHYLVFLSHNIHNTLSVFLHVFVSSHNRNRNLPPLLVFFHNICRKLYP